MADSVIEKENPAIDSGENNSAEKNDFSPEKAEEFYTERSMRFSAACLAAVLLVIIAAILLINLDDDFFRGEAGIFETGESGLPQFFSMEDGLEGGSIKLMAESFEKDGNTVTVRLYGENHSGKEWRADGKTFMLSSFSTRAAKTRNHYYADNWADFSVESGGSFSVALIFTVYGSADADESGSVYTLSAFRGGELPAIEIILS